MKKYENEGLGVSFELNDPITLGDYEEWVQAKTAAMMAGATSNLAAWWIAAGPLVQNWQCESVPETLLVRDVAELSDEVFARMARELAGPELAIIAWVGQTVNGAMNAVTLVPKN